MECYVGLDVHSKASVFVIQDGRGQVMAPSPSEGKNLCKSGFGGYVIPAQKGL